MTAISVVIPTYRRHEFLSRCLKALANQTMDEPFEVVIADDGAEEAIRHLVEQWGCQYGVSYQYVPVTKTQGPAGARNAGADKATSSLLAFLDDDCIPAPHWLRSGLSALREGADAVQGRVIVPLPSIPTDYELNESGLASAGFVTANCFCTKAAFENVGKFDVRYGAAWREDSDLYFALLRDGKKIVAVPDALIIHPVRPAPWGTCLSQQRKSMYDALLFKKYPGLYRTAITAPPPWRYYCIALATLAALAALAAADWPAVAVFTAVWAGLVLDFARRRLARTSKSPSHILEMVVTSAIIPYLSLYWRLRGAWQFKVAFV